MRSKDLAIGALIAVAVGACTDSDHDLSQAAVTWRCGGPLDGGFAEILLAEEPIQSPYPPAPYVLVLLNQPAGSLAPGSWTVNVPAADAFYSPVDDWHEKATSGTVRIARIDSTSVNGSLQLHFPSRNVATDFDAFWMLSSGI